MDATTSSIPPQPVRWWRTFAKFVAGLVLLDFVVWCNRTTWEQHSPDDYAVRVEACAMERRDLVFVGGSPIAEGINPDHLGSIRWHGEVLSNVYSIGLSGGTTTDVFFGTKRACPVPPKVLVYGMTASDINDRRHEPHGVHSLMDWTDVRDWQRTRPEAAEWVLRHYARDRAGSLWQTYRYRHGLKMWLAKQADGAMPGFCPESRAEAERQIASSDALRTGRGYVPTPWFAGRQYDEMKAGGWQQPPFEYLANYATGSHLKYLDRLADWCCDNGVSLVLVDMPTTADLEARHPAEFSEYRDRVRAFAMERRLPIVSANRESTGLNDAHFADLIHLNRAGADRLSAWIGSELTRLGESDAVRPSGRLANTGGRR